MSVTSGSRQLQKCSGARLALASLKHRFVSMVPEKMEVFSFALRSESIRHLVFFFKKRQLLTDACGKRWSWLLLLLCHNVEPV